MDSHRQFVSTLLILTLYDNCFSTGMFENVALNKSCNMSSTWFDVSMGCGGAVNGNTDGQFLNANNCIHTRAGANPSWWEVDLGRPYPVHSIIVWARNRFLKRMVGVEITVDGQECYRFNSTPSQRNITITCTEGVLTGTVIRASKNATAKQTQKNDDTINICEFQVLSCSDGLWGIDCGEMCGNCSNGEVCDKVTGHCSSCSLGLEPPLCRSGAKAAEGTSETWVTVGASLGALVIMAIVVAAVVVCDRWEPSQSEAPTDQGEVTEIGSIPGEQSERPVTMQFPTEDAHDYLEIIPGPIYDQLQTSQDGRESHFYSALQTDQRSK